MKQYLDLPPANLNLYDKATPKHETLSRAVSDCWRAHETEGIFLPKVRDATWSHIPIKGKVAGFLLMRRAGIPWNVNEYNEKASSRLCKIRQKTGNMKFRQAPENAHVYDKSAGQCWKQFRERDSDEEEHDAQMSLEKATLHIAALEAQLLQQGPASTASSSCKCVRELEFLFDIRCYCVQLRLRRGQLRLRRGRRSLRAPGSSRSCSARTWPRSQSPSSPSLRG